MAPLAAPRFHRGTNIPNAPQGVTIESVEGIDHVRGIGNIGAHMEADVNVNVSIEPEEAQILIELIEILFDEWYIAQHKREEKFNKVKELGVQKKQEKETQTQKAKTGSK